jgi:chromosome segregation ATPase
MKEKIEKIENSKKSGFQKDILLKEEEEREQKQELEKKENELKLWIEQSNQSIKTNAEVKQIIIETTQRTITLQEQLLETEKNLYKIDLKLQELVVKNKHLEQMRFVLEHRMKSLEKEKAPLEGQCNFLVRQKQKLEEEFNKLTLQIKLKNQDLESKQSQLKANLMQNFEVFEQLDYLKHKLGVIKSELFNFKEHHKNVPVDFNDPNYSSTNADGGVNHIYQQNKATFVAFKLKEFYDKFFKSSINYELMNYRYFKKQLKEETEKINASSNHDLILRNKGEEKLKSEKDKLEQIKVQKEIGFKRMENENTVLIAEANRLRKYLHEVYLRVVDIERKFESLTNINPTLSKTEIVFQIKKFIKETHDQIKYNFTDKQYTGSNVILEENEENYGSGSDDEGIVNTMNSNTLSNNGNGYGRDGKNNLYGNSNKNKVYKVDYENERNIKSDYEGLILPPINK